MNALVAVLLAASQAAADSAHYIVLNHGRPAGEMHVSATPDSVVVRFRYQDRQRGPRFETLYQLGPNRRVLALETRTVTPEGTLGPVTQRVDFRGDSVRSVVAGDTTLMAFPRLAALAEISWSPQGARDWETFRMRLAFQGPRLSALGVNFYRSAQVPWATR